MDRRDKDNYYLDIAETVSERGTCIRRNYGSIIVKNDEIISTGYTGAPRGRQNCIDRKVCIREELKVARGTHYELCRSVHSEANAITKEYVQNANSCSMCKRMIINSGIEKVVIRDSKNEYRTIYVKSWIEEDDSIMMVKELGY